jgi:hypothetical protein
MRQKAMPATAVDGGEDRLRYREQVAEFLLEVAGLAAVRGDDRVWRLPR